VQAGPKPLNPIDPIEGTAIRDFLVPSAALSAQDLLAALLGSVSVAWKLSIFTISQMARCYTYSSFKYMA
jgi:hypothetical protein